MAPPPDGMAPAKVPANLPELVRAAFNRARASGDVHFFETQAAIVNVNSLPFQLRFSPALANKPRAPPPPAPSITDAAPNNSTDADRNNNGQGGEKTEQETSKDTKKPYFDPFDSPPQAMLVTPLPPSHNLVLNKFAIVPEHFILATQTFKEQTHLLEREDLEAAYACIQAYHNYSPHHPHSPGSGTRQGGEESELFVFFNSGAKSGSSQPHRHVQLLPVARMREGLGGEGQRAWRVLASGLVKDEVRARVPFLTFAERIGEGADLIGVYLRLYRRACEAILGSAGREARVDGEGGGGGNEARVDYNLAMTRDVMVIAPRVEESEAVALTQEDGKRRAVGKMALNGTVLAGTALVKSQAEWDALRAEPEQLLEILGRIGVPTVQAPSLL